MKAFMIILSLMFVSCVTANTRDLSGYNPETEPVDQSEATSEPPLMLAGFDECVQTCVADGYCGPSGENCDDACRNACK